MISPLIPIDRRKEKAVERRWASRSSSIITAASARTMGSVSVVCASDFEKRIAAAAVQHTESNINYRAARERIVCRRARTTSGTYAVRESRSKQDI